MTIILYGILTSILLLVNRSLIISMLAFSIAKYKGVLLNLILISSIYLFQIMLIYLIVNFVKI